MRYEHVPKIVDDLITTSLSDVVMTYHNTIINDITHALVFTLQSCKTLEPREQREIMTEFWHSLNRKGVVHNDDVEQLMVHTYAVLHTVNMREAEAKARAKGVRDI